LVSLGARFLAARGSLSGRRSRCGGQLVLAEKDVPLRPVKRPLDAIRIVDLVERNGEGAIVGDTTFVTVAA
jgi:hypothetical protein